MILFYSIGGGLGHLTRFGAFINTIGIDEPVTMIASSPFARDNRVVDQKHKVLIPPFRAARTRESLVQWLQTIVDDLKPRKIYIDAFPSGILGELNEVFFPAGCESFLLARIIKWPVYRERIPGFHNRFKKVFQLEELSSDYLGFLQAHADSIEMVALNRPEMRPPAVELKEKSWLVIHSGPDSELQAILQAVDADYEKETEKPQVLVVYPGKRPVFVPSGYEFMNIYPAYPLFPYAERVYSAAGFNMVDQMKEFRSRHYVMPFERILDDQFKRCELYRNEFARVLSESEIRQK
ncbi:MAG: hypothetical protein Kow0029_09480 [Candidatus Rifleibacteriota bacterium]